jgi:hypothetical protein
MAAVLNVPCSLKVQRITGTGGYVDGRKPVSIIAEAVPGIFRALDGDQMRASIEDKEPSVSNG